MSEYHTPVMLDESISALVTNPSGTYADVTFGGGGHTAELLSRLNEDGHVIAFDRDSDAINNRIDDPRLILIRADFRYIHNFVMLETLKGTVGNYSGGDLNAEAKVDGVLADLGVSSHQFDTADRGFSFRFDAPLDMRMNKEAGTTAADIVNTYPQNELEKIFRIYGELDNAMAPALPDFASHKILAKIYQALRIEVNHEMRSLEKFLEGAAASLKGGGRLSVITYHSLEDRMVKNFIKAGNIQGELKKDFYGNVICPLKALTRKPVLPQESEIAANTRARSAKLRVAEKEAENES